jgi:hypothetical protein
MKEKKILIIDDATIEGTVERLQKNMVKRGFTPVITIINLSNNQYKSPNDATGEILLDPVKIKEIIKKDHFDIRYDVVACDFNFANDIFTGFELLKWLINTSRGEKKRIRNAIFIFYSFEEEKFIEHVYQHAQIIKLINLEIDAFENRTGLPEKIPTLLTNQEAKIDYPRIIRSELEGYAEHVLKPGIYMPYEGKTLGRIVDEVEREEHHGVRFIKSMIERTTAHIIELNDD